MKKSTEKLQYMQQINTLRFFSLEKKDDIEQT